MARGTVELNDATGLPDKSIHLGQAQSSALPRWLGREERLEGAHPGCFVHARAAVGNRNFHIVAGLRAFMAGDVRSREGHITRADDKRASVRHGVTSVDRNIQERAFQLVRITVHRERTIAHLFLDNDLRTDGTSNQVDHPMHQSVGLDWMGVQRVLTGKVEQPACEGSGAFNRFPRIVHEAGCVLRAPLSDAAAHKLQATANGVKHIIEIMRDAAGKLAHRLHLLRLAQRRLDLLAFRGFGPQFGIRLT